MTETSTVITIGNLDGVHIGHQELLRRVKHRAAAQSLRSAAMFFTPHPVEYFAPSRAPGRLTTLARRESLLKQHLIDEVFIESFDSAFADLSPEAFVTEVLVQKARARAVVVGPFFAFGKNRAGTLQILHQLGEKHGLHIETAASIDMNGSRVSSTRVRNALSTGNLEEVTQCLGRVHDIGGTVVKGDQRARGLGFPTANLDCETVLLPTDGVYSVMVRVPGVSSLLAGVANLGVRPTFEAGRSLEVHIFDFNEDLYGAKLRVGFCSRLRDEQRFESGDALVSQIKQDAAAARTATKGFPLSSLHAL